MPPARCRRCAIRRRSAAGDPTARAGAPAPSRRSPPATWCGWPAGAVGLAGAAGRPAADARRGPVPRRCASRPCSGSPPGRPPACGGGPERHRRRSRARGTRARGLTIAEQRDEPAEDRQQAGDDHPEPERVHRGVLLGGPDHRALGGDRPRGRRSPAGGCGRGRRRRGRRR